MGEQTAISWCDHTFNAWVGCTKVSAACDHCYAESWAKRTGQGGLWEGARRRTSEANWRLPLKWNRKAAELGGRRPRVFCSSLADVFDNQVPDIWRSDLWQLIEDTPNLDWLLLTKRPQNVRKMIWPKWDEGLPPNVWLGTTVENQVEAKRRIQHLIKAPARTLFLSCEPLLGEIELGAYLNVLDWVICGGESGGGARPMSIQWARKLRDDCKAAGVPFHFKQWGEWAPAAPVEPSEWSVMQRVGKKTAGWLLDGREHHAFPYGD